LYSTSPAVSIETALTGHPGKDYSVGLTGGSLGIAEKGGQAARGLRMTTLELEARRMRWQLYFCVTVRSSTVQALPPSRDTY
jgi:hypothetical protein